MNTIVKTILALAQLYYSISTPRYFKMNWGLISTSQDDVEYAPNGDWSVFDLPPYQYDKDMIYGYEIIEE